MLSPDLKNKIWCYRVLQANPLAPSLMNSQAMQGNHNNNSLTIIGLGRIRQETALPT